MGKSQSRPGSNWSWSYKRRENPEGDAYILRGCINTRYRDSEDNLWTGGGSSDPVLGYKSSHGTPRGSHEFDGRQAERPVGLAEDLCSLKVALPPEVTGSRCSLKVLAMQDNLSSPSKKLSQPSQSESDPRGTIGAVDCDVSLDAEKETQEWAFTLYDFDGHRRITREDLSSVLKSISEALACSVMLPPSGSRKLKLRLSVVSDQESDANASPKKSSQTSTPSHDNQSQQKSATTQSTSVPTTSPPSFSTPLSTKQESAENAFNRVRDHDMGDACRPPNHRHSFHGGHQCWQKDEKRSRRSRNHVRSQSATQADIAMHCKEQVSPERRHRKARKSSSTPDQGKAANRACKQQLVNNGTNCIPQERPQENAERRSYYQELAGIEHQCVGHNHVNGATENFDGHPHELPHGAAAANVRTHGTQRQSKGSPHHRRSRSCEPQNSAEATGKKQPSLFMTPELFAKYEYAQRHHKDYHMQLLEASRARLEGYQPQYQMQAAKQTQCRHSIKRHSLPVQVVTTQYAAPQVQAAAPARGKHRRKSRRHHTLQPLTVMKHEIMEKTEGLIYSPVTHKHQHHHHHEHHEHHHHHHYHHYHDINE